MPVLGLLMDANRIFVINQSLITKTNINFLISVFKSPVSRVLRLQVRIPLGTWVFCLLWMLSAVRTHTAVCTEPIPCPAASYRRCVRHWVWSSAAITLYNEWVGTNQTTKEKREFQRLRSAKFSLCLRKLYAMEAHHWTQAQLHALLTSVPTRKRASGQLYADVNVPSVLWIEGCVGNTAGMDNSEDTKTTRPCRISKPDFSVGQDVALTLYAVSYPPLRLYTNTHRYWWGNEPCCKQSIGTSVCTHVSYIQAYPL
jgi:hypothetical protein